MDMEREEEWFDAMVVWGGRDSDPCLPAHFVHELAIAKLFSWLFILFAKSQNGILTNGSART